ncbi:MAG: YggT family protein [Alphaproteobacteria bacterium]|nr:YggT family protein [Alphaproteobacteria bacterium]
MGPIIGLISLAITIYIWIILIQVLISWLVIFDVINVSNSKAQNLISLLKRATDPVFKPLQKVIPNIGGIDITPIVVILGLSLLRGAIVSGMGGYGYW